jgi:uroporphyrin-III C-methyltransferase / precorrin-2 dehydrogenase / sirohydrochlorin ferrochelatase
LCRRVFGARSGGVHSLPIFLRLEGRPVILLGDGAAAAAKRKLLERAGARITDENAPGVMAIVALEDETAAQAAIARLKARGIPVNAVDRPADCDFTLPAIIDRDPVLIAIGTGGASAGLAKALRQRLELLVPQSLGTLAEGLKAARGTIRARWPAAADRRRAIDAALDPGGVLDPLGASDPGAVDRWLAAPDAPIPQGLKTLAITSDDPDDLTLAQARWLGQADTIFHAPAIHPAILARARADALRIAHDGPPADVPPGLTLVLIRAGSA